MGECVCVRVSEWNPRYFKQDGDVIHYYAKVCVCECVSE